MAQGSSNPTADIKKLGGVNISVGAGNSDTGTQRVVLATNQSSIPVTGTFWQATQPVSGTVAATQSGTWNIGSITTLPTVTIAANSSVNLNQIAGVTTATGNGVVGTGVQRVAIASDNTAFSVNANQAGTWNITNISGTVSLPTGAATSANQTTQITALQLLDDAVGTSGTAIATGMYRVGGTDGTNNRLLSVNTSGHVNIADGGNSITVDGTVAATQSGTWNIGSITTLPALPAGSNNIGDVDVLSVVPGTGATNLGKQTDSAAGATDTGVAILAIRDDALTTLTPVDGDYTRFRVNSTGRLWTSATIDAALPTGSNVIGGVTQSGTWNVADGGGSLTVDGTVAATQSGTWTVQPGNTANTTPWLTRHAEQLGTATALGALNASISQALLGTMGAAAVITATATPTGITLTPQVSFDGGTNWTATRFFDQVTENVVATLTSFTVGAAYGILASDGATHVRVIATAWTSGSVTVRLSATNSQGVVNQKSNALHDSASGDYVQLIGAHASSTAPTAVGAGDAVKLWATTSGALNIADGGSTISIDDGGGAITVDGTVAVTGTFWQATQPVSGTVTANQGGTWNITNISGTVSLPTGAATAANQATEITALQLLDDAVGTSGTAIATGMYRVGGTDGTNNRLLSVNTSGHVNIADGGNSITVDGSVSVSNFPATQTISGTVSVNALPAGTNNIGDVDVLSVVPGIGATNLGKQTDSAAGATDTGVAILAIRDDALTTLTPVDGDYTRFRVNSVGRLWASATIDAALPTGANVIGGVTQSGTWNIGSITTLPALPAGSNTIGNVNQAGTWTVQPGNTANTTPWLIRHNESLGTATALGALNANIAHALNGNLGASAVITATSAPTGIVLTAQASYDGGTNYVTSTFYNVSTGVATTTINSFTVGASYAITTGDGATHVRVIATSWTSGSVTVRISGSNAQGLVNLRSTAVHDDAAGTYTQLISGFASSTAPTAVVNGDAARIWTTLNGAVNIADGGSTISIDDGGGAITVDGTVTVTGTVSVNALPAGTNNIGDVDVLSVIPGTGATNLGKQTDSAAGATDTGVAILGIRDDALTTLTPVDGDYTRFRFNSVGRLWTSATIDSALPTGSNVIGAVTQSGTWNIGSITTLPALPAGSNNIGDVDVLSVIPGTGATNLGKQTDSAAGATDTGVAILAIRDDALTTLTPADGDYTRFRVNSVGRLWTSAAIDTALPAGTNNIGDVDVLTLPAVTIAASQTLATVTTVGTVTSVSQFAGQAINLNAGTAAAGTLRVVEATGATGTQTNPSVGTTSVTLLAANTNRRAATIFNGSTSILYLRLSATAASTTTFTCKLQPDDYYEVPTQYNGAITGILNTGSSTLIQVTEIT